MNNQKQANANDPLGIIGKKMKGFKFEVGKFGTTYNKRMDAFIGRTGEITDYCKIYNSYCCNYGDRAWYYPAELIKDHLVDTTQDTPQVTPQDTPQELTLLEKFEQGWEIKEIHGTIAVQVVKQKLRDSYAIEWSDGEFVENYPEGSIDLICTPPKERKTLYLYERDEKTSFCVTTVKFPECGIITEIHLEKNGDKWEVVNP